MSKDIGAPKRLLIVGDEIMLGLWLEDELEYGGHRVLELAVRRQKVLTIAWEVKTGLALGH